MNLYACAATRWWKWLAISGLALGGGLGAGAGSLAAAPQERTVKITFTGTYNAVTCGIVGSTEQTVELPVISTNDLAMAGQTAGSTVFYIPVRCDSGATQVRTYFENGPMVDANTGNLKPEQAQGGQSAGNVEIQLLNGNGTPIRIGERSSMELLPVASTDTIKLPYIARYYATGPASAGSIRTYVTYVTEVP